MELLETLAEFIKSANLQVIIPVVTGVSGGLAAVVGIVLRIKGYNRLRFNSQGRQ